MPPMASGPRSNPEEAEPGHQRADLPLCCGVVAGNKSTLAVVSLGIFDTWPGSRCLKISRVSDWLISVNDVQKFQ
ncbi:hypothetical protein [Rhizobium mongolense]|uniref:Uncharacterized protein n=1 Tax=Rhizobium mongolense TaxID=57676 RepID=A0ABR6IQB4_9HYPH|nr:hypothetical protein [Rhizobium mongolense]